MASEQKPPEGTTVCAYHAWYSTQQQCPVCYPVAAQAGCPHCAAKDQEITQLKNARQQHIALQEFVLRKHADIFKTLDAEIARVKAAFDEHIRHTGSFLNELFAVMVDPVYEGPAIDVKEMRQQLKDAALRDREAAHNHADAICAMYREIESLTAEHAKALAEAERAQLERDCAAVCHYCLRQSNRAGRDVCGKWQHYALGLCLATLIREADYQRREREKGAGNANQI